MGEVTQDEELKESINNTKNETLDLSTYIAFIINPSAERKRKKEVLRKCACLILKGECNVGDKAIDFLYKMNIALGDQKIELKLLRDFIDILTHHAFDDEDYEGCTLARQLLQNHDDLLTQQQRNDLYARLFMVRSEDFLWIIIEQGEKTPWHRSTHELILKFDASTTSGYYMFFNLATIIFKGRKEYTEQAKKKLEEILPILKKREIKIDVGYVASYFDRPYGDWLIHVFKPYIMDPDGLTELVGDALQATEEIAQSKSIYAQDARDILDCLKITTS